MSYDVKWKMPRLVLDEMVRALADPIATMKIAKLEIKNMRAEIASKSRHLFLLIGYAEISLSLPMKKLAL